jgi:ribosome maturation factor RimP
MSKIQAELLLVTALSTKRGEDRQDFLARLMKGVADLNDKQWDGLSQAAQDWFNDAADAKNAKAKTLPDFPDAEAEEAPAKSSRRGAAKEEAAPAKPKVGVVAKITTKRGKSSTGTIVEIDDDVVVIKMGDGTEEEFDRTRVESIECAGGGKEEAQDEPEGPSFKVGSEVTVLTKRGKSATGKIVEMDDELLVLDVDGKDEEFNRERIESITVVGGKATGKKAKADEEEATAKSSRRGAAKDDAADAKEDGEKKRSTNAPGVSVGTRIKEIIADDLDATEEQVGKILKKEGIEYRENTLKLNYVDCHKFIEILKKKKMIKG